MVGFMTSNDVCRSTEISNFMLHILPWQGVGSQDGVVCLSHLFFFLIALAGTCLPASFPECITVPSFHPEFFGGPGGKI